MIFINKILKRISLLNDINNLQNKNLQIGDTLTVDQVNTWISTQSGLTIPYIYINGNFIQGKNKIPFKDGIKRDTHPDLIMQYQQNMNLHKNDIVKKSFREWFNEFPPFMMEDYNGIAFIISEKNEIIILAFSSNLSINEAKNILQQKFNLPIYYLLNNTISRLAKLNNYKVLKIYG